MLFSLLLLNNFDFAIAAWIRSRREKRGGDSKHLCRGGSRGTTAIKEGLSQLFRLIALIIQAIIVSDQPSNWFVGWPVHVSVGGPYYAFLIHCAQKITLEGQAHILRPITLSNSCYNNGQTGTRRCQWTSDVMFGRCWSSKLILRGNLMLWNH